MVNVRNLYISGDTDDNVLQHGDASSDAFLQKPFAPVGLVRKLSAVLDDSW